jgi:hypothetical protein
MPYACPSARGMRTNGRSRAIVLTWVRDVVLRPRRAACRLGAADAQLRDRGLVLDGASRMECEHQLVETKERLAAPAPESH